MAKAALLLPAAIYILFLFFVYDVPIPKKYFFSAPGEGVGAEGFVECAVGVGVHFFLCQCGNPMLMDLRKRRGEGFLIERTEALAFIAAKNVGRPLQDLYFFRGEIFLLLCEVGLASEGIEFVFSDGTPGTADEAFAAAAAIQRERLIRSKRQCGQDGSDGDEGAVCRMDQAVIFSKEPKPGGVGKPAVDHGRGIHEWEKLLARVRRGGSLYDFLKIAMDDFVVVHGPCVERDISFFRLGWSVWE